MEASPDDPETFIMTSTYEGNYVANKKGGFGKMIYPNQDVYEGEWFENMASFPS